MDKVTIEVIGLDRTIAGFHSYMNQVNNKLLNAVASSANKIQNEAKKRAPVDLGRLRRDINHVVKKQKNAIVGEIRSDAPYSAYVEYATKPHWTSVSNLRGWAARKGLNPYAVQAGIASKGTKAQPFMAPALESETPYFINEVANALKP